MAVFSFFISSVLNVIGMFIGSFFVRLMEERLIYYSIIIIAPMIFVGGFLVFFNKLESQFLIFLLPAFIAFIVSHFVSYFSLLKGRK